MCELVCGDCVEVLKKKVVPGAVDLVFADPPFGISYEYDVYKDDKTPEEYLAWSEDWMQCVSWALRPNGTFWLAIGDKYVAELKIMAEKFGFNLRSWVIWYFTFGVNCTNNFTPSHTHLLYFTKDKKNFTFNFKDIAVPSARELIYKDKRAKKGGRLPDNTWLLRPQNVEEEGGLGPTSSVQHVPRVAGTFKERAGYHGCQMPEAIMARIILACSNEGDLVVDPFSGSGTTMVVAKKLNRSGLGIDISENYITQSKKRLAKVKPGDPISGGGHIARK